MDSSYALVYGTSSTVEMQRREDPEAAQSPWPPRNFADNQDTYRDVFLSMFTGRPRDTKKDLATLLTPDFYMQSAAGLTFEFPEFVKFARWIRAAKLNQTNTTVMFLRDGQKLAAHFARELRMPNGITIQDETWHFAVLQRDGRIARLVETKDGRIAHLVETKETPWQCIGDSHTPSLMEKFARAPNI